MVDSKTKADPESVKLIRAALARGNMYCKETCAISDSTRVLGLDLYQRDNKLRWHRRDDIQLYLDTSQSFTRRELAAWCGRLVGHVPIATWLRPHAAMLLRVSSYHGWNENVGDIIRDLVCCVQEKLQCEGDPATGIWYCPSPSSPEVAKWHIESDASGIAMAATLSYESHSGERVYVRDACWLLDRKASLRHVNVNELCAAAQALVWASPYVGGHVCLHVDNECVRT